MNRQYYSVVFIISACLLLSLFYSPPFDPVYHDTEVYGYAGMAIMKGQVPYRDFFDHKPPLIFFVNFAGLLMGRWGLWIIDFFLVLLSTLTFFDLCRKYKLPYPLLLPLLFNLMIRDFLIFPDIGMTREYTAMFQLLFFCVLLGKYRHRYLLLGILGGLTFFMQQDQVFALVPFGVYALLMDDPMPVRNRLIRLVSGFLTITLPILIYFAGHHALGYFWYDAFQFNFSWYTAEKKSLGDHFRSIKLILDNTNYEFPFMIAVTLGVTALFLQNKRKGLVLAALTAVFFSMSSEFLKGKNEHDYLAYYFVSLSASLPILLFTVFAFTEDRILADRKAQLPYGFLLCCSLCYTALQHGTHLERRNLDSPVLNYLREHKPGDYQVYIFTCGDYNFVYNELKTLSPSMWIYQHFWRWYDRWDADGHLLRSIGQDLIRHRTTYILVDSKEFDEFRNAASMAWWKSFLEDHYQPVQLSGTGTVTIWKIKDPA